MEYTICMMQAGGYLSPTFPTIDLKENREYSCWDMVEIWKRSGYKETMLIFSGYIAVVHQ